MRGDEAVGERKVARPSSPPPQSAGADPQQETIPSVFTPTSDQQRVWEAWAQKYKGDAALVPMDGFVGHRIKAHLLNHEPVGALRDLAAQAAERGQTLSALFVNASLVADEVAQWRKRHP